MQLDDHNCYIFFLIKTKVAQGGKIMTEIIRKKIRVSLISADLNT